MAIGLHFVGNMKCHVAGFASVALVSSLAGALIGCTAPTDRDQTDALYLGSARVVAHAASSCSEPSRYEVRGDMVVDAQSGDRLWQRNVDGVTRSLAEAKDYCAAMSIDGLTGWRLPTSTELQSIRLRPVGIGSDPDACIPSIDQDAFPGTPAGEFWTSTSRATDGTPLYTGFDDGRTHPADATSAFNVRCVHDAVATRPVVAVSPAQ